MMNFPTPSYVGQQYSNGFTTYQWDGTGWNIVPQMGPITLSDIPPDNPAIGQQWWRSSNGQLYIWYDDGNSKQWVQSAGGTMQGNIAFPATQVSSADPNVLDDYEEGTWGPVITPQNGAFANMSVVFAQYTKIGRVVSIQLQFNIISAGTAANGISISLPFPPIAPQITCYGREVQSTGKALTGQMGGGSSLMPFFYDNSQAIGNNYFLVVFATYFAAT